MYQPCIIVWIQLIEQQFAKLKEFQHKVLKQHFKTDAIQFEFLSEELFEGGCRFLIPQLSKALWEVAVEYQTTNKQGRPISNPRCAVTMVQRMISKTCNEKLVSKVLMLHNDYCIACNGKNMNLNKRGEAGDSCLHLAVRGAFDTYADAYQYQKVKKYYAIIQNLVDSGAKTTFRLHKDQASALECAKVLLGHEEKKALAMNRVGLEQPEAKERSAKVLDLRRDIVRFLESRSH